MDNIKSLLEKKYFLSRFFEYFFNRGNSKKARNVDKFLYELIDYFNSVLTISNIID